MRGLQGLRENQNRKISVGNYDAWLRHIPHRIVSTTAAVDKASIQKRPCFLCAANLPVEERGVALNAEFTAYCNPFPIVEGHLTVVHNDHRWQAIAGQLETLIQFAKDLPDWLFIYNGPECGASAPDHLHFQALARHEGGVAVFPLERDVRMAVGSSIPNYRRRAFVIRGSEKTQVAKRVERLIEILAEVTGKRPEPLLNIAAFAEASGECTIVVFPRSKHRPRVYETGELTVSPASVDLAGIVVVPMKTDYEKASGDDIARIFDEVTLDEERFNAALQRWEQGA
jgi:hypothetical protein